MLDVQDTNTDNRTKDMNRVFLQEMRREQTALEEEARAKYNREHDDDIAVAPLEEIPEDLQEVVYPTGRERDWSLLDMDMQAEYGGYLNAITMAELEVEADRQASRQRRLGDIQEDLAAFQAEQESLIDELYRQKLASRTTYDGNGMYFKFKRPKIGTKKLKNLIDGLTGSSLGQQQVTGGGDSSMESIRPSWEGQGGYFDRPKELVLERYRKRKEAREKRAAIERQRLEDLNSYGSMYEAYLRENGIDYEL